MQREEFFERYFNDNARNGEICLSIFQQQNTQPAGEEDFDNNHSDDQNGSGSQQPQAFEKEELLCVTRQVLKKMRRNVLVGDFVEVTSIDWTLGHGVVKSVLPRNSIFQTPAVANVEVAILMFSLKDPPIEQHQVNRFLVAAEGANLPEDVVVVLNKETSLRLLLFKNCVRSERQHLTQSHSGT